MKYKVKIKMNKDTMYEVEIDAHNENEAMEFAYDFFERESYADVEVVK